MNRENPHAKWKSIKMELVKNEDLLSITINPPDIRDGQKILRDNDIQVSIHAKKLIQEVKNNLKNNLKNCSLELYPELSPTGRFHLHGLIRIHDVWQFYWRDIYYLMNNYTFELDLYNGSKTYNDYLIKQKQYWTQIYGPEDVDDEYPIYIHKYKYKASAGAKPLPLQNYAPVEQE